MGGDDALEGTVLEWRWGYEEAMLLQQEYACWRAELRLDPEPRHYLMLARWEELARLHCGSMLHEQFECEADEFSELILSA